MIEIGKGGQWKLKRRKVNERDQKPHRFKQNIQLTQKSVYLQLEMTSRQNNAYLRKMAKWLLKATLLFSLSAFSGYAYSTQEGPVASAKTELVIAGRSGVKQYISYHQGFAKIFKNQINSGFYQFEISKTSLISERLFKIAFDSSSKLFLSSRQSRRFQLQKTIPQNSDEDLPNLFIG